jgi:ribosomal protein S18 acetylase RimI-like enzyme
MILGFVAGTDEPSGFYRRLLQQRWWRFGLTAIKPLLRQPAILPRLTRAFSMPKEASLPDKSGMLMSIAVMPNAHGSGVGQALVREFLTEAKRRGLERVNLTTDQENNDRTNRFYQKMGFSCIRSYITPEGRKMNEYLIQLLAE